MERPVEEDVVTYFVNRLRESREHPGQGSRPRIV
jgi:hypothetical protein